MAGQSGKIPNQATDELSSYWVSAADVGKRHTRGTHNVVLDVWRRLPKSVKVLLITLLAVGVTYGILGLLSGTTPAVDPPTNPTLIVAGDQLGPIRIGMSEPQVVRILGQPTEISDSGLVIWNLHWSEHSVWVVLLDKQRRGRTGSNGAVFSITTRSSAFRTKEGIRIGSSVEDVIRTLGKPPDSEQAGDEGYLAWWGLKFGYRGSRVVDITVTESPSNR